MTSLPPWIWARAPLRPVEVAARREPVAARRRPVAASAPATVLDLAAGIHRNPPPASGRREKMDVAKTVDGSSKNPHG